jgi:DNA-binding IclR family transcriptional regulator
MRVNVPVSSDPVPSLLRRAVSLLDLFTADPYPKSYSVLLRRSGIPDASFSRLLTALTELGLVEKDAQGKYVRGTKLENWALAIDGGTASGSGFSWLSAVAGEGGDSVGVAVLEYNKILIEARAVVADSFQISPVGTLIHFEKDHAAVFCILDQVPREAARSFVTGEFSTISSWRVYEAALRKNTRQGYYVDRSQKRPGLGRLAVPFTVDGKPAALFAAGTLSSMRKREKEIAGCLRRGLAAQ